MNAFLGQTVPAEKPVVDDRPRLGGRAEQSQTPGKNLRPESSKGVFDSLVVALHVLGERSSDLLLVGNFELVLLPNSLATVIHAQPLELVAQESESLLTRRVFELGNKKSETLCQTDG